MIAATRGGPMSRTVARRVGYQMPRHSANALSTAWSSVTPSCSSRREDEEDGVSQRRTYHTTTPSSIAPFLPEIIIGGGIIGGWAIHRISQGKPLTPDEALEAQELYRRQEEDLRRRQQEYQRQKKQPREMNFSKR
ncbi:unnamed protein product [Cylindrotheca closterium]|uniref:Uncharacterized protein n=1 Tax=Cylindrotheca closterium TaxID=2856 RepID=A0AAD2FU10_9STRA|nr:unnamed protein product [Cylindrotheca closterium]